MDSPRLEAQQTRSCSDLPGLAADALQDGRLYNYEELPVVLKFNKYIRTGYRAGLSYERCCHSILQYHNETGNIHSHLQPVILIVVSLVSGILKPWSEATWAFYEHLVPIVLCLLGSVCYHTFMARHEDYKLWISVDVCGVFILFLGGAHVILWWGFACYPLLRNIVTVLYFGTAVVGTIAAVRARSAMFRAVPLLLLFVIRVAAFIARLMLEAGSPAATWHYATMEVLSFVGGLINVLRVPERWFQPKKPKEAGLFDYWCNSHQIMHVLVALAMFQFHLGAADDYQHFRDHGDTCKNISAVE